MGGFPPFRGKRTFYAENRFFAQIRISARNFAFLVKSCTFPVLGPQKTSQKLVFIKGFEQGTHKVAFGAQKCTFGTETHFFVKIATFGASGWKKQRNFEESGKGSINYKEYQRFGRAQNGDFSEIPNFLHENENFHRKRKIICAVCATFRVFWSRAARMRQAL